MVPSYAYKSFENVVYIVFADGQKDLWCIAETPYKAEETAKALNQSDANVNPNALIAWGK